MLYFESLQGFQFSTTFTMKVRSSGKEKSDEINVVLVFSLEKESPVRRITKEFFVHSLVHYLCVYTYI